MEYEARYQEYQQAIEKYLNGLFTGKVAYGKLYEAMRYAILGGGKRIRPVLTLEFARGDATLLLADPRRPALHGRRRSAPGQAHLSQGLR